MNRQIRRAQRACTKAQADRSAALLARLVLDVGPDGRARRVTDQRAVAALERGFRHLLRTRCEVHVLRIADEAARGFPCYGAGPPPGWEFFLAVGIDRIGRATYLLRPVRVDGAATPADARRMIEEVLVAELRQHLEDDAPLPFVGAGARA